MINSSPFRAMISKPRIHTVLGEGVYDMKNTTILPVTKGVSKSST